MNHLKIGDKLKIIISRNEEDESVNEVEITVDKFVADNFHNTMLYTIYLLHKRIKDLETNITKR